MSVKAFDVKDPSTYKYNQDSGFEPISIKHIICDGCPYAQKDSLVDGKVVIRGSRKILCEKYDQKPTKFLMETKSFCEFRNR